MCEPGGGNVGKQAEEKLIVVYRDFFAGERLLLRCLPRRTHATVVGILQGTPHFSEALELR